MQTLFDTDAEMNIIFQHFTVKHQLKYMKSELSQSQFIDDQRVYCFEVYQVRYQLIDTWEQSQNCEHIFYILNKAESALILELSALKAECIQIDCRTKTWHFNIENRSMKVQFSAEFVQKIKNESTVYAILWAESADSVELTVHIQSAGVMPALSKKYDSYTDVFSEENADLLSAHKVSDHAIDLNEKKLLYDLLYNLFNTELEVLRDYLENVLVKNWIRHSVSSAETLILFVLKKDKRLQLYVDYRELNQMIIKNRHSLSLISKTLNRLSEAKYFIKLNLKDAYHWIHIKKGNEWKTVFYTHYSHFKYMIMLFELVNASATFQAYINWVLVRLIDIFCVIYLNDILIYSETLNQHHKHVKKVLERLWKFQLYASLKKCKFSTQKVKFLRFIISITDVVINSHRVEIIQDWPTSKIFCEV